MVAALLVLAAPAKLDPEAAWRYAEASKTHALIVVQNGKTIFERYANGWSAGRRHLLASGTKSFVGTLALAAAQDGLLRLDDPASDALTEWKTDPRKSRIAYRQLVDMTSGLEPGNDLRMGWAQATGAPAIVEPGTSYAYASTHQNSFAAALERLLKRKDPEDTYEAYLARRVARPLGITIEWRVRGAEGKPQVAGGAACTARDWVKYGEWMRGTGAPILRPEGFRQLFRGSAVFPSYALGFWVKGARAPDPNVVAPPLGMAELASPDVPADLRAAMGLGEQRLGVVPSLGLTTVRFGPLDQGLAYLKNRPITDRRPRFTYPAFFRALLPKG